LKIVTKRKQGYGPSYVSRCGGHEEHVVVDELLALLGQNWRLLLLYPGGLTALVTTMIVGLLFHGKRWWHAATFSSATSGIVAASWLTLITLLPLPQTGWPYGLDVLSLILLLELPYVALVSRRGGESAIRRIGAVLNCYPLLALAAAALGQGTGSLVVREINRSTGMLHWIGIIAWSLTLPPLLGIGPWRSDEQSFPPYALRQTAHIALLLALALPAHDATPMASSFIGLLAIALPLAAIQRWWHGRPEHWIRWQPWLVVGVALFIAALSGQQLVGRLR
jgi:hypothetical protein